MPGADPLSSIIGGGLGLVGGIASGIMSMHQKKQGDNIVNNLRAPTYYIPGSQNAALNLAQSNYNDQGLPGQASMENSLSANTASGLNAAQQGASSSGDVIDALTKLYQNQNQNTMGLKIQAAQQHMANSQALQAQLGNQAQYEDKAFNYNQDRPYQQALQHGTSLQAAGRMGIQNALNSITGLGASVANGAIGGGNSPGSVPDAGSMSGINPGQLTSNPVSQPSIQNGSF